MLQAWVVIAVAFAYIGLLFVVASFGDKAARSASHNRSRLLIYPLCLAIYCTSWTFFGSVGLASRSGFDFLTIYVGPVLMIGLLSPLVLRIVRLAKAQNITSIADFIAARYGKGQAVAATVAVIAIIGSIPYIALQLKAVSSSLGTILTHIAANTGAPQPILGDIALFVALAMAAFAVLFGTRHIDATEHQDGLMLAVATESIVKLIAFLAVGIFVTFWLFDGPFALFAAAMKHEATAKALTDPPQISTLLTMTGLSFVAILLLPRQFHVTVVENHSEQEVRRAAWLFPIYLVLINLFVIPIALAGLLTFPNGFVDSDMFVLALPLYSHSSALAVVAFVGGLSAATAMVIVETVAIAIMVSNDLVVPFVLRRRSDLITSQGDIGRLLLLTRRVAIFAVLFLAYLYYRSVGDAQLASIGLLSFAAVAQLAPAFFGGLIWRRATARGAIGGITVGIAVWAYTLLLPSFAEAGILGSELVRQGFWGFSWLRPQAILGIDLPPLAHGVFWSLLLNLMVYVGFSFGRAPSAIERLQADLFVPTSLAPMAPSFRLWRSSVTVDELGTMISRYIGEERTRVSFEGFAREHGLMLAPGGEADFQLLRHAEHLLASAIGASSSRQALSILLRKRMVSTQDALKLLDDANTAFHYNREILQSALDHVRQGIAVFDKDLQLICWNRQFGELLDLPRELIGFGARLDEMLRFKAERGAFGLGEVAAIVDERTGLYLDAGRPFLERYAAPGLVIEVRTDTMPGGGFVMTFTDITESVVAAEELERSNETLERRVTERTTELTRLNAELEHARADAEEANISKTRFVAAASHDILQPLNAARLYVTSLVERQQQGGQDAQLVANVDASLEAVEEIFTALLDISRLDAGAMKAEFGSFRIDDLLRQLDVEFQPMAQAKNLRLTFVPSRQTVKSDRRLIRRLLQNLISNAIKYTPRGRVLVGCRLAAGKLRVDVIDTGLGIPESKRHIVFAEFQRLDEGARVARGLGLGLSIVERIARMLDHRVDVVSEPGRGSRFSVELPLSSAKPESIPPRDMQGIDPGLLAGMTVLCIDNEAQIRDGMEALLGGWGCRVHKAADIAEAQALLDRHGVAPAGVLVDYHLDAGSGIEVIAALRQRFGASFPAIIVTADRSPHIREEARPFGVIVHYKPIKPAGLRALLAQWRIQSIAAE